MKVRTGRFPGAANTPDHRPSFDRAADLEARPILHVEVFALRPVAVLQDHIIAGPVGLEVVSYDLTRGWRTDFCPCWCCNIHATVMPSRLAGDRVNPTTHS